MRENQVLLTVSPGSVPTMPIRMTPNGQMVMFDTGEGERMFTFKFMLKCSPNDETDYHRCYFDAPPNWIQCL